MIDVVLKVSPYTPSSVTISCTNCEQNGQSSECTEWSVTTNVKPFKGHSVELEGSTMSQRQYDHITSFENGEPNDVNLGAPTGGNGNGDPQPFDPKEWEEGIQQREEVVAKFDRSPFGRQRGKVVVTLTGENRDVYDVFMRFSWYLANQPFDIDYEIGKEQSRFILHPWAVND